MTMYVFEDGNTLRYQESPKAKNSWTVESRKTLMESAGNNISAVLPSQYKNQLDTFIESRNKWRDKKKSQEVVPGNLCKIFGRNIYKLEKVIDDENLSVNILSVAVKNEPIDIKLLTEEECEKFGILFKEGLFPINLWTNLQIYDPIIEEYDPLDMSTYETSSIKEHKTTIRYILLCLSGFKRTDDPDIIRTPEGRYIEVELFLISLRVSYKINIPGFSDMSGRGKGDDVSWSIVYDSFPGSEKVGDGDICDSSGCIYLILDITKDNKGLKPQSLEGLKPSDIFEVSWDVSFSNRMDATSIVTFKQGMGILFEDNIFVSKYNIFWRAIKENTNRYVPLIKQKDE